MQLKNIFTLILLLLAASCTTEEKHRIIPDHRVAMNFKATLSGQPANSTRSAGSYDGKNVLMFATYGAKNDSIWNKQREIMNANPAQFSSTGGNGYEIIFNNNANFYYLAGNDDTTYYFFRAFHPARAAHGVTFFLEKDTPAVEINLALQPDFIMAARNNVQKSTQPVPLTFKHLLSKISFHIEKEDGLTRDVFIESLTAEGHTVGVLYYPESYIRESSHREADPDNPAQSNILTAFPKGEVSRLNVPPMSATEAPLHVNDLLLFPFSGKGDHYYEFRLSMTDENLGDSDNVRHQYFRLPHVIDPNNPGALGTFWEAGKRYNYKIRVKDSSAGVEIAIENAGIDDWYWDGQIY